MGVLDFVGEELAELERQELRRSLREVSSAQGPEVVLDGRRVINFCSNDYLSLADHPLLIAGAKEALLNFGLGTGASRLIVGNQTPHIELENAVANWMAAATSLLFSSGYHANTGTLAALMDEGDVIFSDALNHASIIDGCRLSRAHVEVFAHADTDDLAKRLGDVKARRRLIVVEGLFSMDGDIAPLERIWELAEAHDTFLLVDEAHALGVLGPTGAGAAEAADLPPDPRILRMGTLGKAMGSFGAFLAGDEEVIDFLRNRARSFIFTTAPPALVAAGALSAIKLIHKEPERRARLLSSAETLRTKLSAQGWNLGKAEAHILPIHIGGAEQTMDVSAALLEEGLYVQGIRPPTVPAGACRLRLAVCADHTESHLDRALVVLARIGSRFNLLSRRR